jgi:hypothetical protein
MLLKNESKKHIYLSSTFCYNFFGFEKFAKGVRRQAIAAVRQDWISPGSHRLGLVTQGQNAPFAYH